MSTQMDPVETKVFNEMIENSYLVPNYSLHLDPEESVLYPPDWNRSWGILKGKSHPDNPLYPNNYTEPDMIKVNSTVRDLMKLIDGGKRGIDVYGQLINQYNETWGLHQQAIYDLLKKFEAKRLVSLSKNPVLTDVMVTGSEEIHFPRALALGVTRYCQLRCMHCYGEYSPSRNEKDLSGDQFINILEKCKKLGVRRVQLTGGECTTHPDFEKLLIYCFDNLRDRVTLSTNAYAISEETFEILISNSDIANVVISLNGDEKLHDEFVNKKGSYNNAIAAINRLAQGGVYVEVAMNLSLKNYHTMENTADTAIKNGAADMSFVFAMERGRATKAGGELRPTDVKVHQIIKETIRRVNEKYPKNTNANVRTKGQKGSEQAYFQEDTGNCGIGCDFLAINSQGRISLCSLTLGDSLDFGNVLESTPDDLLRSEFLEKIAVVKRPGGRYCEGCEHTIFCGTCIAQAIERYKMNPEQCKWGNECKIQKILSLT